MRIWSFLFVPQRPIWSEVGIYGAYDGGDLRRWNRCVTVSLSKPSSCGLWFCWIWSWLESLQLVVAFVAFLVGWFLVQNENIHLTNFDGAVRQCTVSPSHWLKLHIVHCLTVFLAQSAHFAHCVHIVSHRLIGLNCTFCTVSLAIILMRALHCSVWGFKTWLWCLWILIFVKFCCDGRLRTFSNNFQHSCVRQGRRVKGRFHTV